MARHVANVHTTFADAVSDRPAEAADRAVPGHWGGDLILGKGSRSAVGTLVERTTRFVLLLHLPDGRDARAVDGGDAPGDRHPARELFRSVTCHTDFIIDTGIAVYFCDPHSPWQRGSNESTNGLLRQYMPKGTT